ncbi:hypothetical protein BC828DRAFT_383576 [Blastocladiella britannica]|nr:hypothetical protein BC828DRAFT_383576 [Blastocladiella britannica]
MMDHRREPTGILDTVPLAHLAARRSHHAALAPTGKWHKLRRSLSHAILKQQQQHQSGDEDETPSFHQGDALDALPSAALPATTTTTHAQLEWYRQLQQQEQRQPSADVIHHDELADPVALYERLRQMWDTTASTILGLNSYRSPGAIVAALESAVMVAATSTDTHPSRHHHHLHPVPVELPGSSGMEQLRRLLEAVEVPGGGEAATPTLAPAPVWMTDADALGRAHRLLVHLLCKSTFMAVAAHSRADLASVLAVPRTHVPKELMTPRDLKHMHARTVLGRVHASVTGAAHWFVHSLSGEKATTCFGLTLSSPDHRPAAAAAAGGSTVATAELETMHVCVLGFTRVVAHLMAADLRGDLKFVWTPTAGGGVLVPVELMETAFCVTPGLVVRRRGSCDVEDLRTATTTSSRLRLPSASSSSLASSIESLPGRGARSGSFVRFEAIPPTPPPSVSPSRCFLPGESLADGHLLTKYN